MSTHIFSALIHLHVTVSNNNDGVPRITTSSCCAKLGRAAHCCGRAHDALHRCVRLSQAHWGLRSHSGAVSGGAELVLVMPTGGQTCVGGSRRNRADRAAAWRRRRLICNEPVSALRLDNVTALHTGRASVFNTTSERRRYVHTMRCITVTTMRPWCYFSVV